MPADHGQAIGGAEGLGVVGGGRGKLSTFVYDVCVIGSGFAGFFLARRLAQRGFDTLVLEAGSAGAGFRHTVAGDADFGVDANRSFGAGGTSAVWNGVISRFLPTDLRCRSSFGRLVDWPLAYDELARYYPEAESVLETAGGRERPGAEPPRPEPYQAVWDEESPALTGRSFYERLRCFPLALSSTAPGARAGHALRLAESWRGLVAARGLDFRDDRPALRLLDRDGRIVAVETAHAGRPERISARQFVLAAGVVESTRLLLSSQSAAWPQGLGNAHDLVGRFVHAHPRLRTQVPRSGRLKDLVTAVRSLVFCDGLRREGLLAACLDVNLLGAEAALDFTLESEPSPGNRIRLDPSRLDAWGRPAVHLECHATDLDRRTMARSCALAERLRPWIFDTAATLGPPFVTWFHPAGSCRMGLGPEDAVVDRNGRVFGLENLHLVGAATFPTSGALNPTLTVVALALRLADRLSGANRREPGVEP